MSCLRTLSLSTLAVASRATLFAYYSLRAIRDPADAAAVGSVGELFARPALYSMQQAMMSEREGRALLMHQPLVTHELLAYSQTLPTDTFGYRYAQYMTHNRFNPDDRPAVRFVADASLRYVMTRYRQCHDFLHVCTGCGRTVEEELAVKLLEWQQTGLPLCALSVVGGSPHLTQAQRRRVWGPYRDWALAHAPGAVIPYRERSHNNRVGSGAVAVMRGRRDDDVQEHACAQQQSPARVRFYLNVPWEHMLSWRYEDVLAYSGIMPLAEYMAQREQAKETCRS